MCLSPKPKPFLNWSGDKSEVLEELLRQVPDTFGSYYEPFIGGGSLFFHLAFRESRESGCITSTITDRINTYTQTANSNGTAQSTKAITDTNRFNISDINSELLNTYLVLKNKPDELIAELARLIKYREVLFPTPRDHYYFVQQLDRDPVGFKKITPLQKAARTIYLNKTCFDGLYKINRKGQFITPIGRDSNPVILDEENLRACNKHLQSAKISWGGYGAVKYKVKAGDFVYFDPPALPLIPLMKSLETPVCTSDLKPYRFRIDDHIHLRDLCNKLTAKGVQILLTNSASQQALELYKNYDIYAIVGNKGELQINSRAGTVDKVIISNRSLLSGL